MTLSLQTGETSRYMLCSPYTQASWSEIFSHDGDIASTFRIRLCVLKRLPNSLRRPKNGLLTPGLPDIVHGDVKCENVLIFEKEEATRNTSSALGICHSQIDVILLIMMLGTTLYCKLTDFGVLRHPDGHSGVLLGGSRPWQAPECSRGHFFEVEDAKRTDVYSFGMLLWRVFLDGDPFRHLEESKVVVYSPEESAKQRRVKRNDAVARLKDEDVLVKHVCDSLALCGKFSRSQLEMLCEVINVTLVNDASRRELDMARIIRLLTPDNWFQPRHPLPPSRMPIQFDAQLLDIEKWHSEFDKASPVVLGLLASGFLDYAEGNTKRLGRNPEERQSAAAYQLAICHANGFGVPFEPDECIKWLTFAAERGSQKAEDALPKIARVFNIQTKALLVPPALNVTSALSSSWASDFPEEGALLQAAHSDPLISTTSSGSAIRGNAPFSYFSAAETCRYDILDMLLLNTTKPGVSEDGVSPLHFLSMWDIRKAEDLGRRLVRAGADINTTAKRGATVGGTPLMWSVYGNHLDHSAVLLRLDADPMAMTADGEDALSFAARLHLVNHLRLLLENIRPAQLRGHIARLIEAAAGGESRFTRMIRHEERWKTAAAETLQLLKDWNTMFPDAKDFNSLLLPAIHRSLKKSDYGRMNTDVQIAFIEVNQIDPLLMSDLLRESILSFNVELFDALLDYGVRTTTLFERKKTLLHLCAKIPDHSLAATAFAPRLLDLGAVLDVQDEDGITPWM